MLVWKEVIRPGSYWHVGQDGKPARFDATPEYVRYLHDQGNAMLASGLSVPVPLEHQPDNKPVNAAERAASTLKHNTGWVQKYKMDGAKLYGLLDIQDPGIVDKLPRTIRYTSPWLNSFTDGNGKEWKGVISHVALTSRPRITQQEPFASVAAALSLATSVVAATPEGIPPSGAVLSRAGLLQKGKKGNLFPRYAAAFSLWAGGVKMAEEVVEKAPEAKGKEEAPEVKGEEEPEIPEDGDDDEMTLCGILREVVAGMWGIDLPEECDEESLAKDLLHALMEKFRTENGNMAENQPVKEPEAPVVQEQAPFYMSLEQVNAITDPQQKAMAQAMLSMQGQLKALAKNTMEAATKRRNSRIERLAKRLPQQATDQLLAMAKGVQLSLGDDGNVTDPMSVTLDILEAGVRDLPSLLTSTSVTEQPHPSEFGVMSEDQRKGIVAEFTRNAGIRDPNAA